MVKRIGKSDMAVETAAAESLRRESSKGVGTPIERRLADAILENARNMEAQAKAMERLIELAESSLEKGKDACDAAAHAAAEADKALSRSETLTWACVDAVERGSSQAIGKAMSPLAEDAKREVLDVAEKARVSIRKSSETAEAWRTQAWKQGWIYQLTTVGKIAAIAAVLCCALVTAYAGWRALPLVRGEVQVVYTQEYQTELDELHEEVSALKEQLSNNDD